MTFLLKRLALGLFLILLASGILLATDQERRAGGPVRVAILQHAAVPVLDDGVAGALEGLAEHGFRDGDTVVVTRFNAHGDVNAANDIARQMVNDPYDLLVTISTASLQAVANANKEVQKRHVFGVVADPFSAGVGLDRAHPDKHPPYMAGEGIFMPVKESFELARRMNPGLKTVGVVWNSGESNSRAFTEEARKVCKELGITLVEATVENSAGVLEATRAVIARGAQAIWVGGDVSVSAAIESVIDATRQAGIPVFTITPGKLDRGTLFDLGVDFRDCGKRTGTLAAEVLKGTDPASVPIRDVLQLVPKRLVVNKKALEGLKENWSLPDDVVRRADVVVDEKGVHKKAGS